MSHPGNSPGTGKAITLGMLAWLLMASLFYCAQAWPQAAPKDPPDLSRDEARQALKALQSPQRRAELQSLLKAMLEQAPAGESDGQAQEKEPPTADQPASEEAPEEKPEELKRVEAVVPLEENGLLARSMRQFDGWLSGVRQQLSSLLTLLRQMPSWSVGIFADQGHVQRFWSALFGLLVIFVVALVTEVIGWRVLKKPRLFLCREAEKAEVRAQAAAHQEHRDATPVEEQGSAARPVDGPAGPALPPTAGTGKAARNPHVDAWRRLPYALGVLLLRLVPVAFFLLGAAIALHWLVSADAQVEAILYPFINAYLTVRVSVAVIHLLLDSTAQGGLNLIDSSRRLEGPLLYWTRFVVVFSFFGMSLAEAMPLLGAGENGRQLVLKAVSLLVHLFVVRLIWQIRQPVGDLLRAPAQAEGLWAAMRNWLARAWAAFATAAVLGIWVVWAFRVQDGLSRLLSFLAVTIGILAVSRMLWILALGALDRLLHGKDDRPIAALEPFYPLAKVLLGLVLGALTLSALFQAWGLDVLAWFRPGSFLRSLVGAGANILVAVVLALTIWQWANAVFSKRIAAWQEQGDLLRAARLRTLLPMLRTVLFIIVALTLVLTVLHQIGINTAPLLAGASIIGVALGFGSQKLVQDFITGMFLLMENAMQVGDLVTLAGVTGTVENLSIRTVRLRAADGSLHIVPFSAVSSVNNTNRGIGNAAVRVGIGYDADIGLAIQELKKIGAELRQEPAFRGLILNEMEVWGVDAMDGGMITLLGQIRCMDKGRWGVQREVNRRIVERFRALGIRIADPRASILLPAPADGPAADPEAQSIPAKD